MKMELEVISKDLFTYVSIWFYSGLRQFLGCQCTTAFLGLRVTGQSTGF
jgi:hypothetical protein